MKTNDKINRSNIKGFLTAFKKNELTGEWDQEPGPPQNLIVNNASLLLRDLMYGDPNRIITKMDFGDRNIAPENALTVTPPLATESYLTNKVFEKVVTKSKITVNGAPAIAYECTLDYSECNGLDDEGQLITEYGLQVLDASLFCIKTRAGIIKDPSSSYKFTWVISF